MGKLQRDRCGYVRWLVATLLLIVALGGPALVTERIEAQQAPADCPVTTNEDGDAGLPEYWLFGDRPGTPPPGTSIGEDGHYGENGLWVGLWPDGVVRAGLDFVRPDGSVDMKFWWYRDEAARGRLTISGHRLDGPAPPLKASVPEGYGEVGFQATGLVFPTPGCWQVTATSGNATLTFVTFVEVRPDPRATPIATPVRSAHSTD